MTQEPATRAAAGRALPALLAANRVPRLVGNFTYLVGLLDLATALMHSLRHRLNGLFDVLPGAVSAAATAATVVSGILLVVLGHSLKRRKVRAWRAATVLLAFSVVLHVVKFEPASGLASVIALVLLLMYRKEFRALGDPSTRWGAVRVGAVLLAVSVVFGFLTIWLNRRFIVGGWPPVRAIAEEIGLGPRGRQRAPAVLARPVQRHRRRRPARARAHDRPHDGIPRTAASGAAARADRRGGGAAA